MSTFYGPVHCWWSCLLMLYRRELFDFMPEDRRKCIPSMVTIMEISVYLEITKG